MIDVHTHILPGVDDGPATFEEAIHMLRLSAASGVTDIIATPHANGRYAYDPHAVTKVMNDLQAEVGDLIRIHRGCELNLTFDNAELALAQPRQFTLAGGSYLLVEMPEDYVASAIDDLLKDMSACGLRPVIAHPERNRAIRNDHQRLRSWVDGGALLQITAQSLMGSFGPNAKRAADRLVQIGLAHMVASDTHDALDRPPMLEDCYRHVAYCYSAKVADRLFRSNPLCILQSRAIKCASDPPQTTLVSRVKRRLQQLVPR